MVPPEHGRSGRVRMRVASLRGGRDGTTKDQRISCKDHGVGFGRKRRVVKTQWAWVLPWHPYDGRVMLCIEISRNTGAPTWIVAHSHFGLYGESRVAHLRPMRNRLKTLHIDLPETIQIPKYETW